MAYEITKSRLPYDGAIVRVRVDTVIQPADGYLRELPAGLLAFSVRRGITDDSTRPADAPWPSAA